MAERLTAVAREPHKAATGYGDSRLAQQLKIDSAAPLKADSSSRVFYASQSGYDTARGTIERSLAIRLCLASALKAFLD